MCGISGYISKTEKADLQLVKNINDHLAHRGPDEEGVFLYENIAIAHKRLSIIDLESGKQPMKNDNEKLIITYNGELYNFHEIRKELKSKGLNFRTSSDTEVVLKAYEYYGNKCVQHFRGMFAFAIVNLDKKEIFMARDHLGIKPLVYYQDNYKFAFASEIQALKKIDNFNNELDLSALDQYLTYQYIPAPKTIYRKIKKLLPGHSLVVDFKGNIKSINNYWDLEFKPNLIRSKNQWKEHLESSIEESVKLHTISDVDFGAFLSGGIDSTIIVKYMTKALGYPIKTFNIGFKESNFDETHYAKLVAKKYQTNHTSYTIEEDALSVLPQLVNHYGEPYGDFSAVPTYYVSKIAGEHVKMVLSGDGGDEIFAGYSNYPKWLGYVRNNSISYKNRWIERLYPYANKLLPKRYPDLMPSFDEIPNYLTYKTRISYSDREQLWKPEYRYLADLPYENIDKYKKAFRSFSNLNRAQYFDIKTFLPDDILIKVDIASMMSSLEVRTPLIDKNVYELASQIPAKYLLNQDGENWSGKVIFKELLSSDFDDSFLNRPKKGFEIPLKKWLGSESNYKIVKDRFNDPNCALKQYFDHLKMFEFIEKGSEYNLWMLLMLDEWLLQNKI
jgi:asparagine synthase (glutamine-hydrolysing)